MRRFKYKISQNIDLLQNNLLAFLVEKTYIPDTHHKGLNIIYDRVPGGVVLTNKRIENGVFTADSIEFVAPQFDCINAVVIFDTKFIPVFYLEVPELNYAGGDVFVKWDDQVGIYYDPAIVNPLPKTISYGAKCIKCTEYNEYAEALSDYKCYRCRNGY